jgi:hypothetical protein
VSNEPTGKVTLYGFGYESYTKKRKFTSAFAYFTMKNPKTGRMKRFRFDDNAMLPLANVYPASGYRYNFGNRKQSELEYELPEGTLIEAMINPTIITENGDSLFIVAKAFENKYCQSIRQDITKEEDICISGNIRQLSKKEAKMKEYKEIKLWNAID